MRLSPRSFLKIPASSTPKPPAAEPHVLNMPIAVERNGGGTTSQMMGCSLGVPMARMIEENDHRDRDDGEGGRADKQKRNGALTMNERPLIRARPRGLRRIVRSESQPPIAIPMKTGAVCSARPAAPSFMS